jgi:SAM-dependent methyltransferase
MVTMHGAVRLLRISVVAWAVPAGACTNAHAEPADRGGPAQAPAAIRDAGVGDPSAGHPADRQAHAPASSPIDCPLHKGGVDPTHLRPFDQVEKYIAFLEKPEREAWQKPDDVVKALGLQGTETLVDVGAGSGYFAFRFARALPQGKVIATDTEAEMIRHIHHRAMHDGVANIEAVLTKPDDPEIGKDADWVFICDVFHHVPERAAWLDRIVKEMKPGARLALIEFKQGKLPQGPPEAVKIPRKQLLALATRAGLVLDGEKKLLPYQAFLVFRKP